MDLNHRPHAYQACALTKLSYRPSCSRLLHYFFAEMSKIKKRPFDPSKPNSEIKILWTPPSFLRKEVIQPLVPQRLPCYDFTLIISHTLGACLLIKGWPNDFWYNQLSWCDGRCVQGPGTYSPWHADPRLLAIPTSWSRVADSNPNWGLLFGISSPSQGRNPLYSPL